MSAPDRIWAWEFIEPEQNDCLRGGWFTEWTPGDIEYVRADLYRELAMQSLSDLGQAQDAYEAQLKAEAERDALRAELAQAREVLKLAKEGLDWADFHMTEAGIGSVSTLLAQDKVYEYLAARDAYDAAPGPAMSDDFAAGMQRAADILWNYANDFADDRYKTLNAAHDWLVQSIPAASPAPWSPPSVRTWSHYPIQMPVTADGKGPATIGVDAVSVEYEVWEAEPPHHSVASFDNLPDAINEAMRLSFAPLPSAPSMDDNPIAPTTPRR